MITPEEVAKLMHSRAKVAKSSKHEVNESIRKLSYIKEINNKKKNMEKSEKVNILYIVVSDDLQCKIYINDRESPWVKLSQDYEQLIERFKKELTEFTGSEEAIERLGAEFYKVLPPVVRKVLEDKKIDWVWIDCTKEEINPFWEWIYTGGGEPFFWGDRFHIVRIPESWKEGAAPLTFKIENIAIVKGSLCPLILDDNKCLDGLCKAIYREQIGLEDCDRLKNLDVFDGIHVVASSGTFGKSYFNKYIKSIKMALSSKRQANLSNGNATKNRPAFLFLNICGCNKDIQSQIRELISADMWIDTSFEVTEDFASIFAKEFYEEFCTGKSAVEAVTKARQKIGNKNILRLVYVVRGNPYARV